MIRISLEAGSLDISYEESTFHLSDIIVCLEAESDQEPIQKLIQNLRDIVVATQDIKLDKIERLM